MFCSYILESFQTYTAYRCGFFDLNKVPHLMSVGGKYLISREFIAPSQVKCFSEAFSFSPFSPAQICCCISYSKRNGGRLKYSPSRLYKWWNSLEALFLVADFDNVFQLPGKWSVQSLWRPFQPAGDVRCRAKHVFKDQGLFSYSAPEHKQSSFRER